MDNKLDINLGKSEFHIKKIVFLGYIINESEVKIDRAKIKTSKEWVVL